MSETATPATFGQVFEDVIEVLYAPSSVFDRARHRGFGKYLLVLTIIGFVAAGAVAGLVRPWMDATFDISMQAAAAKGQPMPENAVAMARQVAGYGFYLTPLFVVTLGALLGGALLLVAGKIVQAPVRYGQAVLIAALASVPRLIGIVVSGVEALLLNADTARSAYDLSFGPARFLDPLTTSPVLMQFLNGFDVFNLWQLVIFGIGMSVIARVAKSTGFIAGLLAWVLGTALPLIPTLLSS